MFKIIKEIQNKQNQVQFNMKSILRDASQPLQKRKDHERENRIQTVYNDHNNKSLINFLRGIAYNISF